jgi:hypothetical protein
LKAEVQIRTLSQHIWAEASHHLQYKQKDNVPLPVLRSIYRTSALLETIDLEFERLLDLREEYRAEIFVSDNDTPIGDVDILEKILDKILPPQNKSDDEDYSELLMDLAKFSINTQNSLFAIVEKDIDKVLEKDRSRVNEMLETGDFKPDATADRIAERVYYNHTGLIRIMLGLEFGKDFDGYMMSKRSRLISKNK